MTNVMLHEGKPILNGGAVGTDENCCCGEPPCECNTPSYLYIIVHFSANTVRTLPFGVRDCGGADFIGPLAIQWTTCADGNYTAYPGLDVEVCNNGNDPDTATYCAEMEVYFTVSGCSVELTGFSASCGEVIDVERV